MKKHPISVPGYCGSLEELGTDIMRMRYDKVALVLFAGMQELNRQRENDLQRGKVKLAKMLLAATHVMNILVLLMCNIFLFCERFMKDELDGGG